LDGIIHSGLLNVYANRIAMSAVSSVDITSPVSIYGNVKISSFDNPLWTGALYPLDIHTIVPSKKITDCLTGWVLEWSRYVPGTGESNVQFSYSYVPKAAVIRNPGASRSFQIPRDINQAFWKYLYIYEDRIVGHANN